MTGRHGEGTVYGTGLTRLTPDQQDLYQRVTETGRGLVEQLRELVQISHHSAQPKNIEAVRAALFRAHGYQRESGV